MADEGLRFEAFSMPHVGALTRKFDFTKWIESYTLNDRFNDLCDGTLSMPDDYPLKASLFHIDEANHALDVGSMVRILRGATPILHYLVTRSEDSWSDGEPSHKLALEGLEWILDRVLVPNYDHPADPAKEPDWIYGAPSILQNTDLESSGITSAAFQISVNATAGTFTVTLSAFGTSGAINWNADADAIHTAIEAITGINDVTVSGDGTDANPFVIEVLDPANVTLGTLSTNSAGLTGLATIMTITAGGASITAPWTRSFNPVTGLYHGTYNFFATSTVQAHGGTTSLYVNGDLGDWTGSFPGAQQIVTVTGGRTYRASVWVYPKFAARYRFVIRTADETLIAAVEADLTANSWQELAIPSVLMPDHVNSVIFRVACIANVHAVQEFYLDDALLAPGFAAATLGKMVGDVRTAAIAVGSPLAWLVPTWSATLDSDGAAWDSTRQWNVNHGQTFYQLIEISRRWNYESRIRWDAADNRFEWDMWNPSAGGQTRAIAITGKSGVTGSAPIVKRPPVATYVKTEGSQVKGGLPWGEFASTTLDDVWGRLEKFHQDRQGIDSTELDELAERIVTKSGDNTAARAVTVSDPSLLPWTAYEPGDTLTLNLAPKDDKKVLRVAAIVVSMGPRDAAPKYDVHFGAPVYSNDTAIAAGLRTLIREFRRPTPTSLDGTPVTPAAGGGGAPTVVVAAADSTQFSKDRADFQCTGFNDHATIQAALDVCALTGGIVWLCEGVYYLQIPAADAAIIVPPTVTLMGVGHSYDGAAMLEMQNQSDPGRFALVRLRGNSEIRNLTLYAFDSALGVRLTDNEGFMKVTDCWIETRDGAPIEGNQTNETWIERNLLYTQASPNSEDDSGIHIGGGAGIVDLWITRNWILGGWHGIFFDGDQGRNFIANNYISQSWYSGIRLKNDENPVFATTILGNVISTPGQDSDGSTGDAGIYISADGTEIDATTAQSNGLIIADNIIEVASVLHGIRLTDVCLINVHDNYIEQQGLHGIFLDTANSCQIHDNTIQEPGTYPTTTYDGIFLVTSDDNYIRANTFVEHRGGSPLYFRYAINISDGASDRNIVVGNDMRLAGSGTGFINNAGTGTRVVYPGAAAPVGDNFV